ncbi:hypothetical protein B0H14DRAFT_3487401 [Mycena olivaceomarginata]|nr:hypothetical protein B0H14DRAFT_3487401 [Mycena olivaceomarginata]
MPRTPTAPPVLRPPSPRRAHQNQNWTLATRYYVAHCLAYLSPFLPSTSAIVSLWAQPTSGANFLLKPAPPSMATISLYTTAPSLAQADEILDTHINILPFSPGLVRFNCALQQPNPTLPPTASLVSSDQVVSDPVPAPLHLILDAISQKPSSSAQNTLRAPHPLPPPPVDAEADGPVGRHCSSRRTCTRSACASSSRSAGSPSAPSPRWARASTPTRGGGAREARVPCLNNATKALGLGARRRRPSRHAVQAHVLSSRSRTTPRRFFGWGLSLESVHRLGAIQEAKRVWVTWCRSLRSQLSTSRRRRLGSRLMKPARPGDETDAIVTRLRHSPSHLIVQGAMGLACANAHAATTIMIALDTRSSRSCTQRIPAPNAFHQGPHRASASHILHQPALGYTPAKPASHRIETHLVEGGSRWHSPHDASANPSFHAHPFVEGGAFYFWQRDRPTPMATISFPPPHCHFRPLVCTATPRPHGDGMRRSRRSSPRPSAASLSLVGASKGKPGN